MSVRAIALVGLVFFNSYGLSQAHMGDGNSFLWDELSDEEVESIDLKDGSLADWPEIYQLGWKTVSAWDFWYDPEVGDGASYEPDDLHFKIFVGWHKSTQRLYVAMERTDDVYVNAYAGSGTAEEMGLHDSSIEFMIDAGHTGPEYGFAESCCDDLPRNHQPVQRYFAIAEARDGVHVKYAGEGAEWLNERKSMGGGGGREGNKTITEFYITPFELLVVDDPSRSRIADLKKKMIVGFDISVPDFDDQVGHYHALTRISGVEDSRNSAAQFAHAFLVGISDPGDECGALFKCDEDGNIVTGDSTSTAVPAAAWSRIKENFTK